MSDGTVYGGIAVFLIASLIIVLISYLRQWVNQTAARRSRTTPQRIRGRPSLRITGEGWDGEVSFITSKFGSHFSHTRYEVRFRQSCPTLSVRFEGRGAFSRYLRRTFTSWLIQAGVRGVGPRLSGARDIRIGDPDFDKEYFISAAPESFARDFLTTEIRHSIGELKRLGSGSVQLDLHGIRLHVQIGRELHDQRAIDRFLALSKMIVEAAAGTRAGAGFEIVEESQIQEGECQVCGDPMTERIVQCRACGTPHHKECWKYYRMCSTFSCGEKKYKSWWGAPRP